MLKNSKLIDKWEIIEFSAYSKIIDLHVPVFGETKINKDQMTFKNKLIGMNTTLIKEKLT